MYREFNNNPTGRRVGDCAVRAVSLALGKSWEDTYLLIALNGLRMGDMPSSNSVWGALLRMEGFYRQNLPTSCPDCYTVRDFARDHPRGTYTLGLDGHVVTVIDGDWLDVWDSGDETVLFVWSRKDE